MANEISRRRFLKVVGVTAAGLALATIKYLNKNEGGGGNPESESLMMGSAESNTQKIITGNITVEIIGDLPIGYQIANGEYEKLDPKTTKEIRQKAIFRHEPQIVTTVRLKDPDDIEKYSLEKPETSSLPEDTLSPEDLAEKGVRIIQPDTTKLYIRKKAFDPNELLAPFNQTENELIIVLVDSPLLCLQALVDPRYELVRKLLDTPLFTKASNPTKFWQAKLAETRQFIKSLLYSTPTDPISNRDWLIREWEARLNFLNGWNEEDKKDYFLSEAPTVEKGVTAKGLYYGNSGIHDNPERNEVDVIFLAVGQNKPQQYLSIGFDSQGKPRIESHIFGSGGGDSPESHETYPDISQYHINSGNLSQRSGYLFDLGAGMGPGVTLRHETSHVDQTNTPNTPKLYLQKEYLADIGTLASISEAHQTWVNSGYSDNSGYYFVFKLPSGKYILTKNIPSKPIGQNQKT